MQDTTLAALDEALMEAEYQFKKAEAEARHAEENLNRARAAVAGHVRGVKVGDTIEPNGGPTRLVVERIAGWWCNRHYPKLICRTVKKDGTLGAVREITHHAWTLVGSEK